MNDLSGGIGSFLSPQRMQEGGAIDENTNLGGVATPQVITVGMDGKEYPNPAAADRANKAYLARIGQNMPGGNPFENFTGMPVPMPTPQPQPQPQPGGEAGWSIYSPGWDVTRGDNEQPVYAWNLDFASAVGQPPQYPGENATGEQKASYQRSLMQYNIARDTWNSLPAAERQTNFFNQFENNLTSLQNPQGPDSFSQLVNMDMGLTPFGTAYPGTYNPYDPAVEGGFGVGIIGDLPGGGGPPGTNLPPNGTPNLPPNGGDNGNGEDPPPYMPTVPTMADVRVASNIGPSLANKKIYQLPTQGGQSNPFSTDVEQSSRTLLPTPSVGKPPIFYPTPLPVLPEEPIQAVMPEGPIGGGITLPPGREGPVITCPAPETLISLTNGNTKQAGDLEVGDVVYTQHEDTLAWGEHPVTSVEIVPDQERLKLTFDHTEFTCSFSHKFHVDGSGWTEVKDMSAGDSVSGHELLGIEEAESGDVVKIQVEDAHTYISEGMLSHNKSPVRFDDPDDPVLRPLMEPPGMRQEFIETGVVPPGNPETFNPVRPVRPPIALPSETLAEGFAPIRRP